MADNEPCPDEMSERKGSCCSTCGKDNCCCHKTEITDERSSKDPSRKACSSCCACNCAVKCTKQCSSCSQSCCRRRRPRHRQRQTPVAEVKPDPTKACGCTKPKPKSSAQKAAAQKQSNQPRTCCGEPILTTPPHAHSKKVQYPEQFIIRKNRP